MLKYYTVSHGFKGTVDFTEENLKGLNVILRYPDTDKNFRNRVFERLKDVCTEAILKYGTDDDFDAIKTERGAVVFENKAVLSPMFTENLKKAKDIHDIWEEIYISEMDFARHNEASDYSVKLLIGDNKAPGTGNNINRFFGTMTKDKNVNFIENLTEGIKKRVLIKGRPGTGKSTLMKKVRDEANKAGFNTETYHCSFDPESLDMVIIPTLSVSIFDSTPPHEIFPERNGDEIIDLYSITLPQDTDIKYHREIKRCSDSYNISINAAKKHFPEFKTSVCPYSEYELEAISEKLL